MSDKRKDDMDRLIVDYLQSEVDSDGELKHPFVTLTEVTYEDHALCVAYKYANKDERLSDNHVNTCLYWAQFLGFMYSKTTES